MINRAILALFLAVFGSAQIAFAEPTLRIVSFTADWCPTCRVLDPRIEDAIRLSDTSKIVLSQFDLSDKRGGDRPDLDAAHREMARKWDVEDVWSKYRGRIGFAVITAFDSGEALGCLGLGMDAAYMQRNLDLAIRVVDSAAPGARPKVAPECPDSQDQ